MSTRYNVMRAKGDTLRTNPLFCLAEMDVSLQCNSDEGFSEGKRLSSVMITAGRQ